MAARQRETKLVKVYEDLIAKINREANKRGIPFFDMVNDILSQAVKVMEMGGSIREAVDFYEAIRLQHEAGLAMIPFEALNSIVEKYYKSEKETLEKLWFESGVWYGKYLSFRVKKEEALDVFLKSLAYMGWGIKDVNFKMDQDNLSLKCFSLTLSRENTMLLMKFIEGVMNAIGYEVVNAKCLRGVVEAEFKKALSETKMGD